MGKRKKKVKYTREEKREFKRRNKRISLFSSVVLGMFIVSTVYFIINLLKLSKMETVIIYAASGLLVLFTLWLIKKNFSLRIQPKKYKIVFASVTIILVAGILFIIFKGVPQMQGAEITDIRISNNDFAGQWGKIKGIFSLNGIIRLGVSITGKWFYIAI